MGIIESLKFNSDKIRYRTSRSLFIYEHVFVHAGATRGESLLLLCVRTQPILNTHTRIHIYTYRTHIYIYRTHIYTVLVLAQMGVFCLSFPLSPLPRRSTIATMPNPHRGYKRLPHNCTTFSQTQNIVAVCCFCCLI